MRTKTPIPAPAAALARGAEVIMPRSMADPTIHVACYG
jgi:hypothetical protein